MTPPNDKWTKEAESVYELVVRLEDWTGGRQREANVARIRDALQSAYAQGEDEALRRIIAEITGTKLIINE